MDTADFLYNLAKVKLVNARLPAFSILTAVDVLTLGTYPRLPTCISERILPPDKLDAKAKRDCLAILDRIIECRLALSQLPPQFSSSFRIERGYVTFRVKSEFEVALTLLSDNFKLPWRLLRLEFLVKDSRDPSTHLMISILNKKAMFTNSQIILDQSLVHPLQVNYIRDLAQMRLNTNQNPLQELYTSLRK